MTGGQSIPESDEGAAAVDLVFRGYELEVTAEAAAKFPLLDWSKRRGVPMGASWSNSLPASAVTPLCAVRPAIRSPGGGPTGAAQAQASLA